MAPINETTINLFEYGNAEEYSGDIDELEKFLNNIWKCRPRTESFYSDTTEEESYDNISASTQKFLTFVGNANSIRSQRYVGIIKFNNQIINLLPKIFYNNAKIPPSPNEIEAIHANILWWLSYCDKFKFPKTKASFNSIKSNILEVYIYLFATHTRHVLNHCIYNSYEEINNELPFIRGRIDFNTYIKNNLTTGEWHKVSCLYDSFEYDNLFNRIVKNVSNILLGVSRNHENKQLLSEIIFILDEVQDIQATYRDCERVKINPLFSEMSVVLDYCRLFLSRSVSYSYKNDLKVFAFLIPMETIFEEFIYGYLKEKSQELDIINLKYQKSDKYLASLYLNGELKEKNVFNLKHDIYFEHNDINIVCDTKYKLIYSPNTENDVVDKKYGISQNDLYQMTSYAIRRKAKELFLIYPQTIREYSEQLLNQVMFEITDEFSAEKIKIRIFKVPIIHPNFPDIGKTDKIKVEFEKADEMLFQCFRQALGRIKVNE